MITEVFRISLRCCTACAIICAILILLGAWQAPWYMALAPLLIHLVLTGVLFTGEYIIVWIVAYIHQIFGPKQ